MKSQLIAPGLLMAMVLVVSEMPARTDGNAEARAAASMARGEADGKKGSYEAAIRNFSEALQWQPNLVEAYKQRAAAYSKRGMHARAINDLNRVFELTPNDTKALYQRACAHYLLHHNKEAIADFTRLLPHDPHPDLLYRLRAEAYIEEQNYDAAIKDSEQAIRLNPGDARYHFTRAQAYAGKEDYDHAIAEFTAAIRLQSDMVKAFEGRAESHAKKQDFDRAIVDYTEAIRLSPRSSGRLYKACGDACMGYCDYRRALDNYNQSIRSGEKGNQVYLARAAAYCKLGELERALGDCRHVTGGFFWFSFLGTFAVSEVQKDIAEAYNGRGKECYSRKDFEGAIENYTRAIRLNETFADAFYNRGLARLALGHTKHADKDFTRASDMLWKNKKSSGR